MPLQTHRRHFTFIHGLGQDRPIWISLQSAPVATMLSVDHPIGIDRAAAYAGICAERAPISTDRFTSPRCPRLKSNFLGADARYRPRVLICDAIQMYVPTAVTALHGRGN